MMRFRAANPVYTRAVKDKSFVDTYDQATYGGVARKSMFFTTIVLLGALLGIYLFKQNPEALIRPLTFIGILTFITGLVAFVSPRLTKYAGTIYCAFQGLFVGVVSLLAETYVPGVVVAALLGTIMVVFVISTLFLTGIVKVNAKFTRFLLIFAISYIVTMLLIMILQMTGLIVVNYGMAIGISAIAILLASLYLLFDLEMIRQVVEGGQPKQLEWYVSFGLVFTIVWLYLEILRLLVLIMGRRN